MSELRSAVEALRSEALPDLPDARIEEDFTELQRVCELLELERLRRLAEIERRRLFERDGHLSAASWFATRFRIAWGTALGHTHMPRACWLRCATPTPKPSTFRSANSSMPRASTRSTICIGSRPSGASASIAIVSTEG